MFQLENNKILKENENIDKNQYNEIINKKREHEYDSFRLINKNQENENNKSWDLDWCNDI